MVGLENEWYYSKEVGWVYNLQGNNTGQQLRGRKLFGTFRISWMIIADGSGRTENAETVFGGKLRRQ